MTAMLDPLATVETVKRQAYPSWRQFAWLYLMSLLACGAPTDERTAP